MTSISRILVGVDGSEPAGRALQQAADLARRYGAHLTLVYVLAPLPLPPDAYGVGITELETGHRAFAQRLLFNAAAKLEEPSGDVKIQSDTLVLYGNPGEAIAEAAKAEDVGLVVMGSRSRGAIARALLGSVSDRVVHLCEKSVLVVH